LVIALGAMIGGVFAWLFAAIAVGANLIGYFYSDRIALRAVRAQPLTEAQAPEVHAVVQEKPDAIGLVVRPVHHARPVRPLRSVTVGSMLRGRRSRKREPFPVGRKRKISDQCRVRGNPIQALGFGDIPQFRMRIAIGDGPIGPVGGSLINQL